MNQPHQARAHKVNSLLVAGSFAVAVLCCLAGLYLARHWPVVGDVTLIRYVDFLIGKGLVPYSQIQDINFPGSYLLEAISTSIFGTSATGLRLSDGVLCAFCCLFMSLLVGSKAYEGLAGLAAGCLFTLIHLQDGIAQAGQRDLAMAVLSLAALAVLLRFESRSSAICIFVFEIFVGLGLTLKPTMFLLAFVPFLFRSSEVGGYDWRRKWTSYFAALAGLGLPLFIGATWLVKQNALRAFLKVSQSIGLLHSQLARRDPAYLLVHATSPILVLIAVWIAFLVVSKPVLTRKRIILSAAALCGLVSYILQGKGFPYQRYPFLAIILVLISYDTVRALAGSAVSRSLAQASLLIGFVLFPMQSLWKIRQFTSQTPFQDALSLDLDRHEPQLAGGVQCLDTFGGCINVLYEKRLVQSTSLLYDCYLFTGESSIRDRYRSEFLVQLLRAKPALLIVTNQDCFAGPSPSGRGFTRLAEWQQLQSLLNTQYVLSTSWTPTAPVSWWGRKELPAAYRIYQRLPSGPSEPLQIKY